jgi:hypothetical protein
MSARRRNEPSPEQIERHLREAGIVKIEPIRDAEESGHAISGTKSKSFTVEQMKSALLAIQGKLSAHQMSMLRAHYVYRMLSMRQIAALGGYSNYRAGNSQYGSLCGRIARELGFTSPGDQTYTIASVAAERDEKGEYQWRMDEVVVKALEKIGWFRDVANKKSEPSRLATPRRVLFARVGWMTYYAGPQAGDEKPIGGGENNKKNIGHEIFNFTNFGGRLYGFVSTPKGHISFERIGPTSGKQDRLDDVLVVFVARQRIIGWYLGRILPSRPERRVGERVRVQQNRNLPTHDAALPRSEEEFRTRHQGRSWPCRRFWALRL